MGNELEKEAKTVNKMADNLYKEKKYKEATKHYVESVRLMQQAGEPKKAERYQRELDKSVGTLAEEINDKGDNLYKEKNYKEAIEIYQSALDLLEQAGKKWIKKRSKSFTKELNKSKVKYAENLEDQAKKLAKDKNWEESITKYNKTLSVIPQKVDEKYNKSLKKNMMEVYEDWAQEVNNQGDKLYKDDKFKEAIEVYSEAVKLIEKSDDEKKKKKFKKELVKAFAERADEINDIGDKLMKDDNYEKASELYAQSVKIAKESGNQKVIDRFTKEMNKAFEEYGKEINDRGDSLYKDKKYEEASKIYSKSVEIAKESGDQKLVDKFSKEYNKSLEKWAKNVNDSADDLMKAKEYNKAMDLYERAMKIIEKSRNERTIANYTKEYHKACLKLAKEINDSGDDLYKDKQYEESFKLYKKSVNLAEIACNDKYIRKFSKERNKALQKMQD